MKIENAFDIHLKVNKSIPSEIRDAAVDVNDTLNIAWLSAQSIFEDKASPEIAIEIYNLMQERLNLKKAD
ncbi:hypothetical protein [Marinomonas aquiplantarum]|uniref:Uncharacterized protein n=1 Tax=Marinomonas aquiplantarum TaxID=491951 RepID=A0A366D070_9GAMM|nr:hypothetical protein [Marinomonas aquiplantarum]RBO82668.1 hypothetical protein DFP76_105137 [Marinomonas aquiplantarum]